ncbi:hypothetical protein BH11PAT4_BH11PAT4_7130 [soil metagenome]
MGIETPGGFEREAQTEMFFSAGLDLGGLHQKLFSRHAEGGSLTGSDGTKYTYQELSDAIEGAFNAALNLCETSARGEVIEADIEQLPALLAITEGQGLRAAAAAAIMEKLTTLGKV